MSKKLSAIALAASSALLVAGLSAPAFAKSKGPIRIAHVQPMTGPFASWGEHTLAHFQYAADRINAEGGILGRKVEMVAMDNKLSASESTRAARRAIDEKIPFITSGNGSHVAGAIIETVSRHNARNPDNRVLYFNFGAVDPDLTNERCDFWHFRFDSHTGMKSEALVRHLAESKDTKKVFLINQDYSHGHTVARLAKEMLKERRPDVEIVGEVYHPIGQVRDFAPYVARIRNSGADSVITGSYGSDLSLLVRAAADFGLDVKFYGDYSGTAGVPAAIGTAGDGRVYQITEWHSDLNDEQGLQEYQKWVAGFEQQYPQHEWYFHRVYLQMYMMKAAIEKAGSTDAEKVARALEDLKFESPVGTVVMRGADHQLIQPLYLSVMDKGAKNIVENSGIGFRTIDSFPLEQLQLPTSCQMKRP